MKKTWVPLAGLAFILMNAPCHAQAKNAAAQAENRIAIQQAAVRATEAQVNIARARLDSLKASIERARAVVSLAKSNTERTKRLVAQKAVAEAVYVEAEAKQQAAVSELLAAEAGLAVGQAEVARELALHEKARAELALAVSQVPQKVAPAKGDGAEEIKALLKERYEILKRRRDVAEAQLKTGRSDVSAVFQAERDLTLAALDLADSPAQRVEILNGQIKSMETVIKTAQVRFQAGVGSETDVLLARAALLEVRIALLREKAKISANK